MEELDDDLESEIPDLTQLELDSLRDGVLDHAIRRLREEAARSEDAIAGFQSFI
jgi:FXSXX-COOH protein